MNQAQHQQIKQFREGIGVSVFKLANLDDKIKLLESYHSIVSSELSYYRSLKPRPKLPEIPVSLKNKHIYVNLIHNYAGSDETIKNKFIELLKITEITRDYENSLSVNGSSEKYIDLRINEHEYGITYLSGTDQDNFDLCLYDSKDNCTFYRKRDVLLDHFGLEYDCADGDMLANLKNHYKLFEQITDVSIKEFITYFLVISDALHYNADFHKEYDNYEKKLAQSVDKVDNAPEKKKTKI
jgi:hypothetical protein